MDQYDLGYGGELKVVTPRGIVYITVCPPYTEVDIIADRAYCHSMETVTSNLRAGITLYE